MASSHLKEDLECPVCWDIYRDPVTLKCGHSFCRVCIDGVLDTQEASGDYSCPECREKFKKRPVLQKNITLCKILVTLHTTPDDQDKTGVFCTYCIHTPVPAVKSCLMCEASLCDGHLRLHSKSPEHVLCDPTTSLENRKCPIHKDLLKYLDCISVSHGLIEGQQGHQVETLNEASEKKKKLRIVLKKLMKKKEKIEERVQSLQERRRKVQVNADGETEGVTAVCRFFRRWMEDMEKLFLSEISREAERVSRSLSDMIQELALKKGELSRKMRHIEKLCNMMDPLTVQQKLDTSDLSDTEAGDDEESDTGDLRDAEDGDDEESNTDDLRDAEDGDDEESNTDDLRDTDEDDEDSWETEDEDDDDDGIEGHDELHHDGGDLDVAGILSTLHAGLSGIMSGVHVQPTPTVQRSPHQAEGPFRGTIQQTSGVSGVTNILLDVSTACNDLHISDDRKTVSWSLYQNRPETPERFQCTPQVMSNQSFSSGRHYWEVDIEGSGYWSIGMCYPSIDRSGEPSWIGENKKSWCLERRCGWWQNQYSVIHDSNQILLPFHVCSNRFKIELDYEAGRISFYDLCDPIRHLHTFTTTFTEPLHALLWVGGGHIKISGGNQM